MTPPLSPNVPATLPTPGEHDFPITAESPGPRRRAQSRWRLLLVAVILGVLGGLALSDLAEINADYERMVQTLQGPLF